MTTDRIALVAWELGAGRGHLEHLRPVATALLAEGWTVIAAVRDLKNGHAVLGAIDPALRHRRFAIGQAPIFVHPATRPAVRPSSLAEILAHAGFADAALLRPVLEAWERLIAAVKPDVIVGDFAPSVVAAAQGRIPVVMTGNGWTIPPDGSPVPPLPIRPYDAAAAGAAEDRICLAVGEALDGRWRPERFVHLLRGDARFVYTSAVLDPYRGARQDALSWPPNLMIPERQRPTSAAYAVVYLPKHHAAIDRVLASLEIVGIGTHAYFGGQQPASPQNVTVSAQPIDFAAMLPGARFVIHHGGLGVANWCMAYRIPQAVIPIDLEKSLIAHAVESGEAGVSIPLGASSANMVASFKQVLDLTPPRVPSGLTHASPDQTTRAIVDSCRTAAAQNRKRL